MGFLAGLTAAEARAYWTEVFAQLGPGLQLWVAQTSDGTVAGSVQLAPSAKPNGRHRAEVQKLLVHRAWRGRGTARRLLAALERRAAELGRCLLVLDTEQGSPAEALYRKLGWQDCGSIPDFAASTDGTLRANVLFFKRL